MTIQPMFRRFIHRAVALVAAVGCVAGLTVNQVAAVNSPAAAKISFSFDDGRVSTYTKAAPLLAKYGMSGTAFITTGCVGMTKVPNTCHAANDVSYVTWDQIKALQATYNWEIGSHSKTHPYMASTNANDGQPNMLTPQQVADEVEGSYTELAAHGITATAFASPYGDYSPATLQEIGAQYSSHRGFKDQNNNVWPYNDLLLQNMQVQTPVTVAAVTAKIDYAIANKTWLVLTFHDIVDKQSSNPNKYQWATAKLEQIAKYVKAKQTAGALQVVTVSGGRATGNNLMTNGDFASGLTGWTVRGDGFAADATRHGSFPEPAYSAKFTPTLTNSHLLSPRVAVDSNSMYVLKSYLNVTSIVGGEVGFYIDEYDAGGNWISGQYKARENSIFVEDMNFAYVPSSLAVKSASLQVYTSGGALATGYLDSVQWFVVATDTTVQTNLMPNASFDNGIADGWRTDNPTAITADSSSHGSPANSVNSVRIATTSGTSHLFAPSIAVAPSATYYLENYLSIQSLTSGGIGFYIDEYDAAGTWISGQYTRTETALGARDVAFSYRPSSSSVAKASLQVIANGAVTAYFDNSRWLQQ